MTPHRHPLVALLLAFAALAGAGLASADPPVRVARLGYISGAVSFAPAGENEWVQATINRPLITGDRLWVDANARAELQIGSAALRMGSGTSVTLLNLDDRVAQLQLAQGTLNVRVRRLGPTDVVEVDTPNLAFSIRRAGNYRIDVDPDGSATTVLTRDGQAEVFGGDAAYVVEARQSYRFAGTDLRDYEWLTVAPNDEFDRWAVERDRRFDNSVSARYLSRDVIGYEDLDEHGTWRVDPAIGNVWVPSRVAAGWAPYRDGHWAWVEPWGWTWIDDAPWGFAVSHYGRWSNFGGTWGWVPGPVRRQAVYAPALVAFVGGARFQIAVAGGNVGGVAWFPLGPRDVYRPSYAVSRGYFNNINSSNTVINNTTITNVYNNTNVTNVNYANRHVPGAVVAIPTTAFAQSQSVSRSAVRMRDDAIANAPVVAVAAVAPTRTSVSGPAARGREPPANTLERPVVARTVPPAPPVAFAAKEHLLETNHGKPLDAAALQTLRPATTPPARQFWIAAPTPTAGAVAAPPPQRKGAEPRGQPPAAGAQLPANGSPPAAAPVEPRGRPGPNGQPIAPGTQQPPLKAPPAATPADARGRPDPRVQPPAPGAQTPPPVAPTPAVPTDPRGRTGQNGQPGVPGAQQPPLAPPPAPASTDPRSRSEPRTQPPAPGAQTPPPVAPTPAVPADPRGRTGQNGQPGVPGAQQPPLAPPPAPASADPRSRSEPRTQPPAPSAQTPPAIAPTPAVPPDPRGRPGQSGQPGVPGAQQLPLAPPPAPAAADPRARTGQGAASNVPDTQRPPSARPPAVAPTPPPGRSEVRGQPGVPVAQPPAGANAPPAPPPVQRRPEQQPAAPEQRVKPEQVPAARPVTAPPPAAAAPPQQRAAQPVARPEPPVTARPVAPPPRAVEPPAPPPAARQPQPPQRPVAPQAAKPEPPPVQQPARTQPAVIPPAAAPPRAPAAPPPASVPQQPNVKQPPVAEKKTPEQLKKEEEERKRKQ